MRPGFCLASNQSLNIEDLDAAAAKSNDDSLSEWHTFSALTAVVLARQRGLRMRISASSRKPNPERPIPSKWGLLAPNRRFCAPFGRYAVKPEFVQSSLTPFAWGLRALEVRRCTINCCAGCENQSRRAYIC